MKHNIQIKYKESNMCTAMLIKIALLCIFITNLSMAQRKDQAVIIPDNHLELVEFYATSIQNGIELAWVTELSRPSEFFSVERAGADGIFYSLTKIPATGQSRGTGHYHFLDNKVEEETSYYRITKIDADGDTHTSSSIVAYYQIIEGVKLGPNPVLDNLQVVFRLNDAEDSNLRMLIIDQQGNTVLSQEKNVDPQATQQLNLDLSNFDAGFYLLRLEQGSFASTHKFIKR